MNISAEFKNGICCLVINPADEWEQKLLGSVAKGKDTLSARVIYEPEGHFSYSECRIVKIYLGSTEKTDKENFADEREMILNRLNRS